MRLYCGGSFQMLSRAASCSPVPSACHAPSFPRAVAGDAPACPQRLSPLWPSRGTLAWSPACLFRGALPWHFDLAPMFSFPACKPTALARVVQSSSRCPGEPSFGCHLSLRKGASSSKTKGWPDPPPCPHPWPGAGTEQVTYVSVEGVGVALVELIRD